MPDTYNFSNSEIKLNKDNYTLSNLELDSDLPLYLDVYSSDSDTGSIFNLSK